MNFNQAGCYEGILRSTSVCAQAWQRVMNRGVCRYTSQRQTLYHAIPDSKVHGANMGPTWGRQDPGGPHVVPMNLAIWDVLQEYWESFFINFDLTKRIVNEIDVIIDISAWTSQNIWLDLIRQAVNQGPFSIYGWIRFQLMREDITYVTSSLIGWDLAQP